jgi:hypothetical protein
MSTSTRTHSDDSLDADLDKILDQTVSALHKKLVRLINQREKRLLREWKAQNNDTSRRGGGSGSGSGGGGGRRTESKRRSHHSDSDDYSD